MIKKKNDLKGEDSVIVYKCANTIGKSYSATSFKWAENSTKVIFDENTRNIELKSFKPRFMNFKNCVKFTALEYLDIKSFRRSHS